MVAAILVAFAGHALARAMPPDEPADPVCESGAQTTVIDDAGVAHVACVLSEAPPADTAPTTTVLAPGLLPPPQSLPKTGRNSTAAALGMLFVTVGAACVMVSRRRRDGNAFRARSVTP